MIGRFGEALAAAAGSLLLLAAGVTPAGAAPTRFTCTYVITAAWAGGFSADLSIHNAGPATTGWRTAWTMAESTTDVVAWGATTGRLTPHSMSFSNDPGKGRIATGGTTSFGWTARAASTSVPDDITVNGRSCPAP